MGAGFRTLAVGSTAVKLRFVFARRGGFAEEPIAIAVAPRGDRAVWAAATRSSNVWVLNRPAT
jgi:hypothetical protein